MEKYIIKKYQEGMSIRRISKEFLISRERISKILKQNDIEIRDNKSNSRKYCLDEDFF